MKRPRGKLHWEDIAAAERSAVLNEGDKAQLQRYIEENRKELEEERGRLQQIAKDMEGGAPGIIPTSNREWL